MQEIFKVRVLIQLRPGVRDPQGNTIGRALRQFDSSDVKSVRVGKFLELEIEANSVSDARELTSKHCRNLLANPVSENWEILSIEQDSAQSPSYAASSN